MKELNIEEKAKRYDEALKVLHKYDGANIMFSQSLKEEMFLELKESEDKRIRKDLIVYLRSILSNKKYGDKFIEDWIAWLEKQGQTFTKKDVDDAYLKGISDTKNEMEKQHEATYQIRKDIATFIFNYRGDIQDRAKWIDYLDIKVSFAEKQGEQKLVKHFCDCVHVGCHVNDCKRWCHSYQKEISYTDCNSNCNRYSKLMNNAFNIGETITDGISTFKIADIKDNHYIADDGERVEIYMAHRYYTIIQNLEEQNTAWSEEDKSLCSQIRGILSVCKSEDLLSSDLHKEMCDWLKSLRP